MPLISWPTATGPRLDLGSFCSSSKSFGSKSETRTSRPNARTNGLVVRWHSLQGCSSSSPASARRRLLLSKLLDFSTTIMPSNETSGSRRSSSTWGRPCRRRAASREAHTEVKKLVLNFGSLSASVSELGEVGRGFVGTNGFAKMRGGHAALWLEVWVAWRQRFAPRCSYYCGSFFRLSG